MNKAGTTSKVSFKRSFTELSNGHGFFYVFLIGRIQNNKKYFVPFFLLQPLISKLTSLFESLFRIVRSLEYSLFKLAQQRMKKINSWKQIKICGNFSPLVAMCCFFHLDQWEFNWNPLSREKTLEICTDQNRPTSKKQCFYSAPVTKREKSEMQYSSVDIW